MHTPHHTLHISTLNWVEKVSRQVLSSPVQITRLSYGKKYNAAIPIPPDLSAFSPSLRTNEHAGCEGNFVAGELPTGRGLAEDLDTKKK